jgi:hypothetical protein
MLNMLQNIFTKIHNMCDRIIIKFEHCKDLVEWHDGDT